MIALDGGVILDEFPPFDRETYLNFELVAPGIAKIRGGDIFAHDGREEVCEACGGRTDDRFIARIRRKKNPQDWELRKINDCKPCYGKGRAPAIDNYRRRCFGGRLYSPGNFGSLERIQDEVVAKNLLGGCRLHCYCVPPDCLAALPRGTHRPLTNPAPFSDTNPEQRSTVERIADWKGHRMGTVISLLNQKGGVGKTSSCHHISGTLAKAGHRVLVVDGDPQASLTQGFWGPDATRRIGASESVAALYDDAFSPIPEVLIKPTGIDGVSIVPGSIHLTRFNMMPQSEWGELERGMRDFLDEVRSDFSVILVDLPPNLHLCSWAGLVASDFIVCPLQAEDYGAQGLGPVQEAIAMVQGGPNPSLKLAGYLLTMYDKRLGIHLAYEAMLREMYDGDVFAHTLPLAKDYKEAVASRLPISHHKPKGAAGKAAAAVAAELLERIAERSVSAEDRRVA